MLLCIFKSSNEIYKLMVNQNPVKNFMKIKISTKKTKKKHLFHFLSFVHSGEHSGFFTEIQYYFFFIKTD